jgi:hypothetical protein
MDYKRTETETKVSLFDIQEEIKGEPLINFVIDLLSCGSYFQTYCQFVDVVAAWGIPTNGASSKRIMARCGS